LALKISIVTNTGVRNEKKVSGTRFYKRSHSNNGRAFWRRPETERKKVSRYGAEKKATAPNEERVSTAEPATGEGEEMARAITDLPPPTIVTLGNGAVSIDYDGKELEVETFRISGGSRIEITLANVLYKFAEDTSDEWIAYWRLTYKDPATRFAVVSFKLSGRRLIRELRKERDRRLKPILDWLLRNVRWLRN
jgi:hypothetical protein